MPPSMLTLSGLRGRESWAMTGSEQVDGCPQRPGGLNLLRLVLYALYERHVSALPDLEPLCEQRVEETEVQAQVRRL